MVLSFCKMAVLYPGYRIVEEVYMKYKWVWGRHIDYDPTSKWGRNCKELQSSRCNTSLPTCSNYARYTSTAILIAWYKLTYFDALSSHSVKWQWPPAISLDGMASLCKMAVPYPGYRTVEEVYMKYKWGWGRHIYYDLTSKCGRNWKELLSWRCNTALPTCSNNARYTSTAMLVAWYQLTFWCMVLSFCKMEVLYPGYRIVEEVYMKCKYIERCYFYVGSTYFDIIEMIMSLSNYIIIIIIIIN
jgi:hypothetical protein